MFIMHILIQSHFILQHHYIMSRYVIYKMRNPKDCDVPYGNLMSYKRYTRPAACRLYGGSSKFKTRHRQGIREILHVLFENGACSTWDIARIRLRTANASLIRPKEKEYRRLFLGRYDTKKRSGGMLDLGLVVREKMNPHAKYRLSLHGILYCIDMLYPSEDDFERMARAYAGVLPRVFGRWDEIKSVSGAGAYSLRVLAKGVMLENLCLSTILAKTPLCELMSFIHAKYADKFESISEADLAEQVSYWFYTFLQYCVDAVHSTPNTQIQINGIKKLLQRDSELGVWYRGFYTQAMNHYKKRLDVMTADCGCMC